MGRSAVRTTSTGDTAEAVTLYREAATLSDGQGERRCLLGEAGRLTRPIRRRDL